MKKIFIFMIVALMTFGFASAGEGDAMTGNDEMMATGVNDGQGVPEPMLLAAGAGEGNMDPTLYTNEEKIRFQAKARLQGEGQFMLENGKTMQFSGEGEMMRIQSGEHTAFCESCNLSQEDGMLMARMSNGINSEIKIMPDRANERALERLQLRLCDNCSIELKEVGKGNNTQMAYEVKTQKQARLFGIFGTKMKVEAQVNAENGEIIRAKKPWWAFLASETDETETA